MNCQCNIFIYSLVTSQHLLNKPLAKRETDNCVLFLSQLLFSIVEILLKVYIAHYQYGYMLIHQFNKKRMVLQGFELFSCDGIKPPDPFNRLIPTFPVIVQLVGGIGQSVGCRGKFPALLQYFPDLVLLHLYLRMYQQ